MVHTCYYRRMTRIFLSSIAVSLFLTLSLRSQTENSAPIVWERYKVSNRKISFLMPKLPTVHEVPSICGEVKTVTYLAYADGAIYEVTIAGPKRSTTQVNCGGTVVSHMPRKLDARLAELRNEDKYEESSVRINGSDVLRFKAKRVSRWIYPDVATPARWVEVTVSHYAYDKVDFNQFVGSLRFAAAEGKEIGAGSPVTLGDAGTKSSVAAASLELGRTTSPLTLYWRQQDFFTGKVPKGSGELSVVLRVVFLANGSIGAVVPDKQLPEGLTDVAIAAARKISFLPKRRNFLPIDDEQSIRFTFRPL